MANRDNHYEAAFEGWLRAHRVPYVAVDEAKRAVLGEGSLKSLDFIVSPDGTDGSDGETRAGSWLVDVKGRKFPSGEQQSQYWKNWSTQDDLWSLGQWEQLFGESFQAVFVFAYLVTGPRAPLPAELMYQHRDAWYGFVAVKLRDYARWARPISPAWDTVAMPTTNFCELARPMATLIGAA